MCKYLDFEHISDSNSVLPQCVTQLLVQAEVISHLSYWNALVKTLQMVQNAAICLVFSKPKRTLATPLLIELHWLITNAGLQSDTQVHPAV